MTQKRPGPSLDDRDFDAIEAAVMETERGRWFLAEFTRRNRLGETRLLLDAITRIEQSVGGPGPADKAPPARSPMEGVERILSDLAAKVAAGADLHSAVDGFATSLATLDAATADIHEAAERVNETAWRLRESGARSLLCDELERAAAQISTACAFTGTIAGRSRLLAEAVKAIGEQVGIRAAAGPAPPGEATPEPAIEAAPPSVRRPLGTRGNAPQAGLRSAPRPLPTPAPAPSPGADTKALTHGLPRPDRMPVPSLAAIETLDFRERLKLFT